MQQNNRQQIAKPILFISLLFTILGVTTSCKHSHANRLTEEAIALEKLEPATQETRSNFEITTTPKSQPKITNAKVGWNRNLLVDNVPYDLYIPKNYGQNSQHTLPCLLLLPGWNFKRTSWVENTNLVALADRYEYALILPEMGKTLYESSYYPQTTMKWNPVPGGKFIKQRFVPTIQNRHNLLQRGYHNTMLGLSTGGRGCSFNRFRKSGIICCRGQSFRRFFPRKYPQRSLDDFRLRFFYSISSKMVGKG